MTRVVPGAINESYILGLTKKVDNKYDVKNKSIGISKLPVDSKIFPEKPTFTIFVNKIKKITIKEIESKYEVLKNKVIGKKVINIYNR